MADSGEPGLHLEKPQQQSRVFMSDIRSDLPPVQEGAVMRGLGIGRMVASQRADLHRPTVVGTTTRVQVPCSR